jgi:hypothetical protein
MHELGHVLDFDDDSDIDSDYLMNGRLESGTKRSLSAEERDSLFGDTKWLDD